MAQDALDSPRIVIHGAGSIGCYIGGSWIAAGLDVTLLGREAVKREIEENGLTITETGRGRIALRPDEVRFSTNQKTLAAADIVVLGVKSMATPAAIKELARHARKEAIVISFQNGVSNFDLLEAALPKLTILRGTVPFNVARLGNGRWHKGVAGALIAQDHPVIRALAARIGARPGGLDLTSDMAGIAWGKLLVNLNNAVNALSGKPLLEQLGDRDYRRVVAASQIEALGILKAAGIAAARIGPFPPHLLPHIFGAPDFLFRRLVLRRWKIDLAARTSMADDFAAGRATEIDQLNGELVRLARGIGRSAPVNERIVALVRQAEAGVERQWSAKDLREHVLAVHSGAPGFGY